MTDEEEVRFPKIYLLSSIFLSKIPLEDLTTDLKKKPHKHIALGFCRKQQVDIFA